MNGIYFLSFVFNMFRCGQTGDVTMTKITVLNATCPLSPSHDCCSYKLIIGYTRQSPLPCLNTDINQRGFHYSKLGSNEQVDALQVCSRNTSSFWLSPILPNNYDPDKVLLHVAVVDTGTSYQDHICETNTSQRREDSHSTVVSMSMVENGKLKYRFFIRLLTECGDKSCYGLTCDTCVTTTMQQESTVKELTTTESVTTTELLKHGSPSAKQYVITTQRFTQIVKEEPPTTKGPLIGAAVSGMFLIFLILIIIFIYKRVRKKNVEEHNEGMPTSDTHIEPNSPPVGNFYIHNASKKDEVKHFLDNGHDEFPTTATYGQSTSSLHDKTGSNDNGLNDKKKKEKKTKKNEKKIKYENQENKLQIEQDQGISKVIDGDSLEKNKKSKRSHKNKVTARTNAENECSKSDEYNAFQHTYTTGVNMNNDKEIVNEKKKKTMTEKKENEDSLEMLNEALQCETNLVFQDTAKDKHFKKKKKSKKCKERKKTLEIADENLNDKISDDSLNTHSNQQMSDVNAPKLKSLKYNQVEPLSSDKRAHSFVEAEIESQPHRGRAKSARHYTKGEKSQEPIKLPKMNNYM